MATKCLLAENLIATSKGPFTRRCSSTSQVSIGILQNNALLSWRTRILCGPEKRGRPHVLHRGRVRYYNRASVGQRGLSFSIIPYGFPAVTLWYAPGYL